MMSTRWLEFNDMEYLVNKYIKICYGKIVQWNVLHYFIIMIPCLCICHQDILNGNGILGKIKEYIICFELQHHGFIHAHIILWLNENDLQIINNN